MKMMNAVFEQLDASHQKLKTPISQRPLVHVFINKVDKSKAVFTTPSAMEDYLPNNSALIDDMPTLMNIS